MENLELARRRFWRGRRTFVTGATGLLGSWLIRSLYGHGADIVALIRDWVPGSALVRDKLVEQIVVVRGDVRDRDLLQRILNEYEINTVFHLAAQTIVPIANREPVSTFETNIAGTWTLLEACRHSPLVRQIVVASSDKAYGPASTLPYRENTPLRGIYPYDVSKSCADLIAQSYATVWDSPLTIARCGNFFGGGDLNWNRIVPGTIRSALLGEEPVIRSDGSPLRDYVYVEDAVDAYLTLAERLAQTPSLAGCAFNFSNGAPLAVRDLVTLILRLMESPLRPRILNEARNEIAQQFLDASLARRELGWTPRFSVEEGLKQTISWYRDYLNLPSAAGRE